jgi:hypothetical protein
MIIKTGLVRILSFGFAKGMCLYPFVLIGKETEVTQQLLTHERIHLRQQMETFVVPFYVWYFLEFVIRFIQFRNFEKAYRNISFEREAFYFESQEEYLNNRKKYAWTGFLHQAHPAIN